MNIASSKPYLRYLMISILAIAAILIVCKSYSWPLMWDAQVLHYANFLVDKGFSPYREIPDMNTPGAYLIEGWAMHIFGGGDLAWRIYDFTLMGAICASMIAISIPYDWLAGLFAGVMFALAHTSEGPVNAAERDEAMTALMFLAYAFLFGSIRHRKPWMMILFGFGLGMASSIKPTVAPLGFALLLLVWWTLKKEGRSEAPYLWNGILGAGISCAIIVAFFVRYDAAEAFFEISRSVTREYAGLHRESFLLMCRICLPLAAYLLLPFALLVSFGNQKWAAWERQALMLGIAFGAVSYFAQGKGYGYHRYALAAFVMLWEAMELSFAASRDGWVKRVGTAGMVVGALIVVPIYVRRVLHIRPVNQYTETLESDLSQLGIDRLQNNVQCFDMVDGCLNALYHLKIVQDSNSMGDMLYFSRKSSPIVNYYRSKLWTQLSNKPPLVIIISNEWYNENDSFDKLNQWPQFKEWLGVDYELSISREFVLEGKHAYRIYLRRDNFTPQSKNDEPATENQNNPL